MSSQIYYGPWINWSRGLITGATLTLGERETGLLTAFIATFVTIVGAELWKISCYIFHQLRSKQEPQDGLHHQQQVILRTYGTPGSAAWAFLQQAWFWTGKARLSLLRTVPWALFSTVYVVAIGVLAIFSSEISKSPGPERILIGECGLWLAEDSADGLNAYQSKITNETLLAASYAKACYGGSNDPLRCGRYPKPYLSWDINRNVSCPFSPEICYYQGTAAAVNLTSKLLDSHDDLGINAPSSARIGIQKSTTCAPLRRSGYSEAKNTTTDDEPGEIGDTIGYYYYGPYIDPDGFATANYTYNYNFHALIDNFGYAISSQYSIAGTNTGFGYQPIAALNKSDADLTLMFLSANSIKYKTKVDDPIFSAHSPLDVNGSTVYAADYVSTVLACIDQYRVCNPLNSVCTPYLGYYQLVAALFANKDGLDLSLRQNATATRLAVLTISTSQYNIVHDRGGGSLRATETVNDLTQVSLPNNQWQIEVSAWFDTALAKLQALTQGLAANTANPMPGSRIQPYTSESIGSALFDDICRSQLVKETSGSGSFSILGLAILFVIGGLIIMVSLVLDTVVGFIQQKTGKGLHARMEWLVTDRLHMHMMLMRELRLGQWVNAGIQKVPTTVGGFHKFLSPGEAELRARGHTEGREGDTGAQLVQHENVNANDGKGWHA